MWAGSKMTFASPIRIGEKVRKVITIADIAIKEGKSGLSPDELAKVAKGWELDLSPLDQAEKLADESKPDDVEADSTYHAFRAMVDKAADIADRL